jgi:Ca2+-binding EF-hand superfamily protein
MKDLAGDEGEIPEMDEKDTLFYLFSLHDYNKDGFLDGHELRAAFTDFDGEDPSAIVSLDEVTEMVDHVLEEDDLNGE